MRLKFDPKEQYGNYAFYSLHPSGTSEIMAKQLLMEEVRNFIPVGLRQSVDWFVIAPDGFRPGVVAWKYTPPNFFAELQAGERA